MEKNAEDSEMKRFFIAIFNISEDFRSDLFEKNNTISSVYRRTWESGEFRERHIGYM